MSLDWLRDDIECGFITMDCYISLLRNTNGGWFPNYRDLLAEDCELEQELTGLEVLFG